jgi:transposase
MKRLFMWMKQVWTTEKITVKAGMREENGFRHLSQDAGSLRVNMIAAQCLGQLIAPFTVKGACNRSVFEIWLEKCLIPLLKPGQVVVMDNARFHKGGRIELLIQQAGCQLLYLPAYSPDFNKIERCWSWLKSRYATQLDQFDCLRDAMEHVLHLAS